MQIRWFSTLFLICLSIGCNTRKEILDMKVACKREGEKISQKFLEQDKRLDVSEFVYRVFYSPKLNSCVAAQFTWQHAVAVELPSATDLSLRIVDVLSQKELWSTSYNQEQIHPDVHTELDHQIQVLGLE